MAATAVPAAKLIAAEVKWARTAKTMNGAKASKIPMTDHSKWGIPVVTAASVSLIDAYGSSPSPGEHGPLASNAENFIEPTASFLPQPAPVVYLHVAVGTRGLVEKYELLVS
jgi:hypothetical protein